MSTWTPHLAGLVLHFLLLGSWNPSQLGVLRDTHVDSFVRAPQSVCITPVILSGNLGLTFVVA